MNRTASLLLAPTALAALLASPARAAESYDSCTGYIESLPAVITTPGVWCLASDLATAAASGTAIRINANNVTVDCNDFKLGGLGAGLATATYGIAALDRSNATVRNCKVRGFLYGISLGGTGGGHVVEDNQAEASTYVGISVGGNGSVVRGNRVFGVGGTPLFGAAFGIFTSGDVNVTDNTVSGVSSSAGSNASAYGSNSNANFGGRVQGNRVRQVSADGTGAGNGIYFGDHGGVVISDNHVVNAAVLSGTQGIVCDSADAVARDNVVNSFAIGISTCNDASGNDVSVTVP